MHNNKTMTVSDVSYTMSLTRQILEKNRLKNKYQILNFYCNWCLHPELTRSMHCYWILEQIADALVIYADKNPNDFTKRISEIISFKNLKKEINALFKEKRIPRFLFKSLENWNKFISLLIQIVKEKPIKFPDKIKKEKIKDIYDSIKSKINKIKIEMPMCFWFSEDSSDTWKGSGIPINSEKIYVWNVELFKGEGVVVIRSPIIL